MTLPLLALVVFGFVFLAWAMEFRHKEETIPTVHHRRHIAPVAAVLLAALLAIPIVLWPLASLSEWPRSTQVAWTAAEGPSRNSSLTIGGPEHSAVLGWPNGNFWPEVRVERPAGGGLRLLTRGGTAVVRLEGHYANGEKIELGGGPRQIGKFNVELARTGFLFRRRLIIRRTAVADPLVVLAPPPASATRARALDSLLIPRLNDLRREGAIDLATVHALEEWAGSIRVLMPSKRELRLVVDQAPWRALRVPPSPGGGPVSATVEVLWPRRRLVMRVSEQDGVMRVAFEPPWTRTSSLPPLTSDGSSLSFAREAEAGSNTFLLPLGHAAAEFRHDEALQLASSGLPRFRDGADLSPPPASDAPSWLQQPGSGALASLLQPNRALSSVRVPVVVPGAAARGAILTVTMLRDLPTPRAVLLALLLAWALLAFLVASIAFGRAQRLRLRDLWCIGGVLVAIWTILLFRVLLAVRYVVTPAAVDEVTVRGLAGSLAALVIVPGLIALAVRLWLHHRPGVPYEGRGSAITIAVAVVFAAGAAVQLTLLPESVLPNVAGRWSATLFDRVLLVVYAVAALAALSATRDGASLGSLWQIPYRATFGVGRAFWRGLANAAQQQPSGGGFLERHVTGPVMRVWRVLRSPEIESLFIGWSVVSVLILIGSRVAPEYVRQIIAPFWMVGIPALVLLARPIAGAENALRVLDGDLPVAHDIPLADTVAAVVMVAFLPVLVMFGVLGDFGAIYAVLAFWFPLALVLLLTSARRMAATLLIVMVTGVAAAYWALLGTYAVAPGMTEHILSRVEVSKHGASAQEWLLDLEAPSAADPKAVTAANVRNALVHEWEHMAMVRMGGWTGLGFHRAPASQSFIRQDTIQYDSVYSFFVVGEHGIAGGLFLMAVFAIPAVVLLMRRSSLRTGDVLALAIAAALAGEAVVHAAMNVAQLWFTGRNLPLLATASNSDMIRWGLLLGLLCQALLWSSRLQADSLDTIPETVVTRRSGFDPTFGYTGRRLKPRIAMAALIALGLVAALLTKDFAWLAFALAIAAAAMLRTREYAALALLPAVLVGVLMIRGSLRAAGSPEYDVFTWSRLLRRVDELYGEGVLRFDPQTKRILYRGRDQQLTARPTGRTLLEAEVLRFNAMPERLRVGGGRESLPAGFFDRVSSPADYYARVFRLWQRQISEERRVRPSVFAIHRVESESEGVPEIVYEVRGNPDFNVVHSFAEDLSEEQVQPVAIRGRSGPMPILDRAWAMGRWVYAPTAEGRVLGLGWTREAGEALLRLRQPRRSGATQLTIDAGLQRAAQTTVEEAGRALFSRLLSEGAPATLPPRVAFTVVEATTGETLAMGTWPRAASSNRWRSRTVSAGGTLFRELEPPRMWLGTTAPQALAARHLGDHNLEAIEIGSAAKPFWATAALAVHPTLDQRLLVRNGDCDQVVNGNCYERQMFGEEIGKGWQVSAGARWVDFSTYLAASDNRYHTRLGMLGLAKAGANGIADDGRGPSPGGRESLNGKRVAWNRYPALADSTDHNRDRAAQIKNLHKQPMADLMRDLFGARSGVAPAEGELRRRQLSFWSGDERDDLAARHALEPLAIVSPEAVDLRLRRVTNTREYVAVLLGGASSRWSNVGAAAAFSSWAVRRPIVPHIVEREGAAVPLPSRVAAYNDQTGAAARKLRGGLRRVVEDGTAVAIKGAVQPFRANYEVYAKTGTLSTVDPNRPTSRILLTILARDAQGNVRNGITLSFVAERATRGFATVEVGRFLERHRAELVRLLEAGGAAE